MKPILYLLIGYFTWRLFVAIKWRKIHMRNGTLHESENQKAFWRSVAIMAVWLLALAFWAGLLAYPPHFGPR